MHWKDLEVWQKVHDMKTTVKRSFLRYPLLGHFGFNVIRLIDRILKRSVYSMKPFLDKFCADFPGSKWFLAGAGAETGEFTFNIWDNPGGSTFLSDHSRELYKTIKQRKVPTITIDDLIQQKDIPIPDLVKIDVQGFELEVLRGGTKFLLGHTEVFIVEVSFFNFLSKQPIFHEVVGFMSEHGYVVYDFASLDERRPFDGALGQADVCFVKRDGLLRTSNRWN